jgi:hypothetical protein
MSCSHWRLVTPNLQEDLQTPPEDLLFHCSRSALLVVTLAESLQRLFERLLCKKMLIVSGVLTHTSSKLLRCLASACICLFLKLHDNNVIKQSQQIMQRMPDAQSLPR